MSRRQPTDDAGELLNVDKAKQDHDVHWLLMIGAGGYAWQLHGVLVGITVLVLLLVAIAVSNILIMSSSGSLRLIRLSRWGWLIAAYVLVAISGASFGSVS